MKQILLILAVAGLVQFDAAAQNMLPSTPYTRTLLRATNAAHARSLLGAVSNWDSVATNLTVYGQGEESGTTAAVTLVLTDLFQENVWEMYDGVTTELVAYFDRRGVLHSALANEKNLRAKAKAATTEAIDVTATNASPLVVDGITLATGDYLVVKDQAGGTANAVYYATNVGADYFLVADTATNAFIQVAQGTVNTNKFFYVGSTNIVEHDGIVSGVASVNGETGTVELSATDVHAPEQTNGFASALTVNGLFFGSEVGSKVLGLTNIGTGPGIEEGASTLVLQEVIEGQTWSDRPSRLVVGKLLALSADFTNAITVTGTPTNGTSVPNKTYVDGQVGLVWTNVLARSGGYAVTLASTENVDTNEVFQATIDGAAAEFGYIVLLKNQTATNENGLWQVVDRGEGNYGFVRASNYNENAEIRYGDLIYVTAGTANAGTVWKQTNAVNLGTVAPMFVNATPVPVSGGTFTGALAVTGGITCSNVLYYTNAFADASAVVLNGGLVISNLTANVSITGFVNTEAGKENTGAFEFIGHASSSYTVTVPNEVRTTDGLRVWTVTNGITSRLTISMVPGVVTNACMTLLW